MASNSQSSIEELQAIAGSDERVFTADDYSALNTIKDAVLTKQTDCDSGADLIVVLDESSSIDGTQFTELLKFVIKIVSDIDVGDNRTRVGVMTYSNIPRIIYKLSQSQTKDAVRDAIMSIQQKGGGTNTALALKTLHETMLTSDATRRTGSHKVAVVITDGGSDSFEQTKEEARRAHLKGVLIIAIGVGQGVNNQELEAISGSKDRVFNVDNYSSLESIRGAVLTKACETTGENMLSATTPDPEPIAGNPGNKAIDLIWAISNQAGVVETKAALDLIAGTVFQMRLGPHDVQVGVAPRFGEEKDEIHVCLNDRETDSQFFKDLELRELSGSLAHSAIEYIITKAMSSQNGARSNPVRYGILIIDNDLADWFNTLAQAAVAKRANIRLIIIGVGRNVRPSQLRQLASSKDDYFFVDSYDVLAELIPKIIERLRQGINDRYGEVIEEDPRCIIS